jgi:tetratricopeptide (TPR) repeat protein
MAVAITTEWRSFLIAASSLLLISLALIQLPLLNYLGYEFSAAIALVLPWIMGGMVLAAFRRRFPDRRAIASDEFVRLAKHTSLRSVVLLIIPLAVATTNAVFVRNCSYGEGLLFFLLLPVVTALWSVSLALFAAVITRSRWLLFTIVLIATYLHPLYLGYFTPAVYSYNFVYGFFPGFTYDEVLQITPTLVHFRLVTVAVAALLILSARHVVREGLVGAPIRNVVTSVLRSPSLRARVILLLAFLIVIGWTFRYRLGFESSVSWIQSTLSERYSTKHFTIHFAPASFSDEEIRWVAGLHEFRYDQVRNALNVQVNETIDSYIYPSAEVKRKFIGTGVTNIAKPWRNEIHINRDAWSSVLKHELVHILAADFGMPIIRANTQIGLVEGLATAIDGDWGNRTLHEYASGMIKFGIVEHPERLISPVGFALRASTVSYVLMGSFCKFLIDRFGIDRFKQLYGGASPDEAFGRSFDSLTAQWQAALHDIDVPNSWRSHIEFFFKRPSIFARECVRAIANTNRDGYALLDRGQAMLAMEVFHASLAASWNTDGFAGLVRSAYAAARYDSVIILIEEQLRSAPAARSSIINLFPLYGDALWYYSRADSARRVYEEVLRLDISDGFNEAVSARCTALESGVAAEFWTAYFGAMSDAAAQIALDAIEQHGARSNLVAYLRGKLAFRQKRYRDAIEQLSVINGALGTSVLDGWRARLLGEAYFFSRDFRSAKSQFTQAKSDFEGSAWSQRIDDWIERCEWFEVNDVYDSNQRGHVHED